MTTPQQPIGSGFGHRSTAAEVLDGIDLDRPARDRHRRLLRPRPRDHPRARRRGRDVVVPARRPEHAAEALAGIDGVEVDELDLGDLDSVRGFAERFLAAGRTVDILINNAAIMACPETRVGPGWEAQFATNHLGHFALVNRLWPALAAGGGARVVALSSRGHNARRSAATTSSSSAATTSGRPTARPRRANALFAVQLDALGQDAGVRAFAVHPGGILTPLQRHLTHEEMVAFGWIDEDGNADGALQDARAGRRDLDLGGTSPQLDGHGRRLLRGLRHRRADRGRLADARASSGVDAHAVDPDEAARLWAVSAELTGVDAFATA